MNVVKKGMSTRHEAFDIMSVHHAYIYIYICIHTYIYIYMTDTEMYRN